MFNNYFTSLLIFASAAGWAAYDFFMAEPNPAHPHRQS
jgi:hypothetical protein